MINGIAGKPGGGKSYEAVKNHIIPAIKDGRRIVTNLPLQIEHFVAVFGEQVRDLIVIVEYDYHNYGSQKPFSKIEDWLEHQDWKNEKGQGVLFAIDEAHLSLPCGKGGPDLTKVLEFLSMHRHYGFDVLLITQNFKKIHRDIRDMIQLVYRCIKKSMFGQDDEYIIKVHEGCTTQVVNTDERAYESFVFKFYKSHTKSESQIVEATTRDVTPWHKTGLMKASYVVIFFAVLMIVNVIHTVVSDKPEENSSEEVQVIEEDVQLTNDSSIAKPTVLGESQLNNSLPEPVVNQVSKPEIKTEFELALEEEDRKHQQMIADSKEHHPFHKVGLSISGFAEDLEYKIFYFSAQQNGQHVFTLSTKDLLLAGYSIQVLSDCAIFIEYYSYREYLTCNRQTIDGSNLASNNTPQTNE